MNTRYYDPATGRFISQDSYRGDGEGFWHLYSYGFSDPVNHTDPTGNHPVVVVIFFMTAGASWGMHSYEKEAKRNNTPVTNSGKAKAAAWGAVTNVPILPLKAGGVVVKTAPKVVNWGMKAPPKATAKKAPKPPKSTPQPPPSPANPAAAKVPSKVAPPKKTAQTATSGSSNKANTASTSSASTGRTTANNLRN